MVSGSTERSRLTRTIGTFTWKNWILAPVKCFRTSTCDGQKKVADE
jgi:hypothetical protein